MTQLPTPLDRVAAAGHLLYGERWQSDLARDLGVAVRTVQAWFSASESRRTMPTAILAEVETLVRQRRDACTAWLGHNS